MQSESLDMQEHPLAAKLQMRLYILSDALARSWLVRRLWQVLVRVPAGMRTVAITCIILAGVVPMILMGMAVALCERLCARRIGLSAAQLLGAVLYLCVLGVGAWWSTALAVLAAVTLLFLVAGWLVGTAPQNEVPHT